MGLAAKPRLLITGASGFLGWNLVHAARTEWAVYGAYFRNRLQMPQIDTALLDLTDFSELRRAIDFVRPQAVIHTAAISDANFVQQNGQEAHRLNVTATLNLAGLCGDREIPFVFTSTDLVFDGEHAPYVEADPVQPVNLYGEQKAIAEEEVQEVYGQAVICRLPLLYGRSGTPHQSFLTWMVQEMRAGRELRLFSDEIRTPASATTVAKGLLLALEQPGEVLHLGGRDAVSRYEFGLALQKTLGLSRALLTPVSQNDVPMAAPRPRDVSLNSAKAFALNYGPLPLAEELKRLAGITAPDPERDSTP